MALQSSGPISILDLVAEFGGASPHSLSEYYRGGSLVPDTAANISIPLSGMISLTQFYNASSVNRIAQTITLSANQTNYVLNTAKVTGYQAGLVDVTLVINSGVYVSADSTGGVALLVDTSWAAGDTVTIVNNGFVVGRAGNGGAGAGFNNTGNAPSAGVAGSAGASGGLAFWAQRTTSVQNNGTIAGGGGGGGGGANGNGFDPSGKTSISQPMGGGGGGGGRSGSIGSSGGAGGFAPVNSNSSGLSGFAGGPGTFSSPGGGGSGRVSAAQGQTSGSGGTGGAWGTSGSTGGARSGWSGFLSTSFQLGPYVGGAAGAAVNGNSNITWLATGTRLGAIT